MKTLLSFFAAALATTALHAQEFRFSGGFNGSNVQTAGEERWVGRAGYQFGADLLIGDRWFLRPGVHFLVRNLGYSVASVDDNGASTSARDFTYTSRALRIPVQLGFNVFRPSDDPAVNIYAFGGPSALMNLSADLDNDELDIETSNSQWYLGFGAGLTLGFLFVEGGYDVALSNQFDTKLLDTNPKVNYVYASAGLRLRLAN